MYWKYPAWLWAQSLPLLVFLALITGRVLQLRRIRLFGDRQILQVAPRTTWWATRTILLVLGTASIAAILAGPSENTYGVSSTVPVIDLIIDYRSDNTPGGEAEQSWEAFCDNIGSLVTLAPFGRFSVFGPDDPAMKLVSDTADSEGLLLLLNSMQPQHTGRPADTLGRELHVLFRRGAEREERNVVLLSSRTREELLLLGLSVPQPARKPLFIRLPRGKHAAEYGIPVEGNAYAWSDTPDALAKLLLGRENPDERARPLSRRLSRAQVFAFAGFLLLFDEFVGPLSFRPAGTPNG